MYALVTCSETEVIRELMLTPIIVYPDPNNRLSACARRPPWRLKAGPRLPYPPLSDFHEWHQWAPWPFGFP